jgi:hypothetical protein
VWLNGVEDGNLNTTQTPRSDSIQPATIASARNSVLTRDGWFQGEMGDVAIWDSALSANQLLTLYQSRIASMPLLLGVQGLKMYLPMHYHVAGDDVADGALIRDLSPSNLTIQSKGNVDGAQNVILALTSPMIQ